MKTSITKLLVSLALILFASTSFFAQQEEKRERPKRPSIEKLFKDLDTNEDGKISLKEVKGPLKKDFKKIDKNEDGFLSKEEIKKAPKPKRKEKSKN